MEDLKDGYFVEYSPGSVYEDNYGYAPVVDETQCWAEMQGGCTNICTVDENGNLYATIVSVPEGFLQSPGTYFYCDDWYFNAPYSLTIRGFKKFIGDISSEEAVASIAKREKTNVLTWDGIITEPSNLHVIGWKEDESNHYWNYAFFYKVSDAVITLKDLKDGVRTRTYFIGDNGWIDIPFNENEIHLRKDGSIQIYCYDANGNHWDGADIFCYPENSTYPAGVYFGCSRDVFYSSYKLDDYVSGFEIPNVYKFNAINKIDGKYLSDYNDIPNIPVGILPTGGDTLYWDGNTEGLESIENGTFFKVTDAFDADQLFEYETKLIEYNPSPNGGTIVGEVSIRQNDDNRSFSFCGFDGEGNEYVLAHINGNGIYFAKDVNGYMRIHSLTIPGFKKFPLLKKLDRKYLPDTSWDDIKNRPFGDFGSNTITLSSSLEAFHNAEIDEWFKVSDCVVTETDIKEETCFTWMVRNYVVGGTNLGIIHTDSDGVLFLQGFDENGGFIDLVQFRTDGIYFRKTMDTTGAPLMYPIAITLPNYGKFKTIKTVNHKYLPKSLQFGEVSGSDTLICEGNIIEQATDVYDGFYFKMSDAVVSIKDLANGGSYVLNLNGENQEFAFSSDDISTDEYGVISIDNRSSVTYVPTLIYFIPEEFNSYEYPWHVENHDPGVYVYYKPGYAEDGITPVKW